MLSTLPLLQIQEMIVGINAAQLDNKLAEVVPRLMRTANIKGYFTNHSL